MRDIEVRLIGHPSPDGQILAQDASGISVAVQTVITRLVKAVAERSGPGRSEAALEAISRVRLVGLTEGSTRLGYVFGDSDALPMDDPLTPEIYGRFWDIVEGIRDSRRPAGVTDSVAASVADLISALGHAAPTVEIGSDDRVPVPVQTRLADRSVWAPTVQESEVVTYYGRLEALDLRNAVFRIVDDVGNRIPLKEVRDSHRAAQLIDQRVAASGVPTISDGHFRYLADVEVVGHELPPEWVREKRSLAELLADRPGPAEDGGLDLSDEEFDEFMAAIRG